MHCTYISSSFLFHSSSLPLEPSHASLSICSFHSQASLMVSLPFFFDDSNPCSFHFNCPCSKYFVSLSLHSYHLFIHLTLNHLIHLNSCYKSFIFNHFNFVFISGTQCLYILVSHRHTVTSPVQTIPCAVKYFNNNNNNNNTLTSYSLPLLPPSLLCVKYL